MISRPEAFGCEGMGENLLPDCVVKHSLNAP